ncbi:MAG: extracellular solute-binding protein, partial [Halothiobacillaceae bacterium]
MIALSRLAALLLAFLLIAQAPASAAPALALGYAPAYPDGFTHFRYVNPNAPKGGELVLSAFGSFDSLNPFLLKGLSAAGLGLLVFESLLEKSLDEPFSMYGLLAEDVSLAEDGLSVTFRLRPQARFSDGTSVRAQDVKFSFDTLRSDKAHPMFRFYWADVERAEVLDMRTVRFVFKRRNPELHLILGEMPVLSEKWVDGRPFDQLARVAPIGSGPYVVEAFDWGKQIHYRRNPDYWGRDLPVRRGMFNFDRVTFKYYKDRTVSLEAFKAGEFDIFFENHSKRWARDHEGPRYASGEIKKVAILHHNNAGMQGIVFNTRRPLFADRRVREALGLAMDFEWSNRNLFYGQYTRCDSYFSNSEL